MRIDASGKKIFDPKTERKKKKGLKASSNQGIDEKVSFLESLETSNAEEEKRSLEEMISKISETGHILSSSPTYQRALNYKEEVDAFVKKATKGLYEIRRPKSVRFFDNNKEFVIVEKIDQKTEALVESVLRGEQDRLGLLAQVEEIRGLLQDIIA